MGAGDSKLEFKSRINTLEKQVIKPTDHKFWSVLFISPLSVQDIFALITPEDVRGLRSAQPENLATLIFKSIEQLHLFSLPRNIAAECTSARNSLFLLSRILPFVFEHDDDNFVQLLFFDNRIPKKIPGEWIDQMKKYSETYGLMKDKRFEQLLVQQEAQIKEQQQQQLKKKQQEEEEEAEKQRLKLIKEQEAAAQKKKQEEEERLAEEQRKKLAAEEEEKKKQQQLLLQQQQQQKSAGKKGKKNKKNNKGTTVAAPVATTTPATSTSAVPNVEEEAKKEIPVESSEISTEPTPSEQSAEENTAEASKNQSEEAVEQATNVTESADEKQEATSSSSEFDFEEYKKTLIQVVNIGDKPLNETLAHVMIDTLMRSMFIPQFTVPVFQLKSEEPMKPNVLNTEFLWHAGVGMLNTNYAPTSEQMNNRYDVLRCLLACFSQVLYLRVDQCVTVENKFLSVAVSSQMPFITDVVYSLLNTVLKYDPRGSLPYTTQLMTDYDEKVVELSLNMLTLLLHHNPADAEHGNKARQVLESIDQDDDLSYMYNGFARNLNNLVDAHNTYLPGSQRLIPFYEELLVCFWKVLQTNKNFRIFICRDGDISRFIIPLLFLLQTEGKDATKFPLVQMTSFILLLLSGHREFSVALNRPIDIKIPLEVQVQGSFSDLLIVALCKCITSDKGIMKPLFDCLLTVIANISPYVKSMSMIASLKLVNLFEALAAPKYLYTSEKNCHYISLLLETFNNIIQYQYEGNPHIIYSIMRRANVFHELSKKPDLEKISQFIVEREKKREFPLPEHLLFMPTQQWVDSWKPRLPLTTVLTMINILNPEVERLCSRQMATEDDVLNHIKKSTLVGLLPVPHTIIVRTFVTSERIDTYLLTYCWGLIYLKHTDMFSAKHIKLFSVNVDSL